MPTRATRVCFILTITKIIPPDTLESVRENALQLLKAKEAELETSGIAIKRLRDSFRGELFIGMSTERLTEVAAELYLGTIAEFERRFGKVTTCYLDGEKMPLAKLGYELRKMAES